ncbi:hypothetical protein [Nocardia seriolae]|uniref:Haloacid dehalogenase n=1 Tax=Nocardia seriolae TaxID=37332 RepID=A0ABC8AQC5_9NOCA|nr:hypothetical protein [Nocardia seriolae]GEM27280.1 hypothetical protein NS2_55190 [Nocardia seriolae NBRC 15557]APA96362.1 (S)-2-haloacid dehalogenase [Nocardia seriolae]WNJ57969.1 hypothetical protein RMO66_32035 [Nocardia seriolae]BEK90631.1 hypothetical protein NSERKGN1266_65820 [Nocardia seriolae]BEK93647.1 hypothetical protein NSER024013_15530 [Nocardia seriolae]
MEKSAVKALLFDVQGTATDFHSTIRTAAAAAGGPGHDWSGFVNKWRAAYFTETSQQPEQGPWVSVGPPPHSDSAPRSWPGRWSTGIRPWAMRSFRTNSISMPWISWILPTSSAAEERPGS